jgi:hypothetical protein
MRFSTVLTVLLLGAAAALSACQAPPKEKFSRPDNTLKFHAGGYNPGTGGVGHHRH